MRRSVGSGTSSRSLLSKMALKMINMEKYGKMPKNAKECQVEAGKTMIHHHFFGVLWYFQPFPAQPNVIVHGMGQQTAT